MADRPIIFSAPMVRALLEGRKSMTRRVLKPQPHQNAAGLWVAHFGKRGFFQTTADQVGVSFLVRGALRYAPGDRLWVREACRAEELSQPPGERPATKAEQEQLGRTRVPVLSELDGADGVRYLADNEWRIIENSLSASDRWLELFHYRGRGNAGIGHNVPPIHMPRLASRLTLVVTEVRVERLQEISEADAVAEGAPRELAKIDAVRLGATATHKAGFQNLWDSLHGPEAWDANPWVAAVSFTVHRCNIDRMEASHG